MRLAFRILSLSFLCLISAQVSAEVSAYGAVDSGILYSKSRVKINSVFYSGYSPRYLQEVNKRSLTELSQIVDSSIFGIKGNETISPDLSVGFQLENGFESDSGQLQDKDRLFDREASLSLASSVGTFFAGRIAPLTAGVGSFNIFKSHAQVFGGQYSLFDPSTDTVRRVAFDNMVGYISPTFSGLKLYAQYSFNVNSAEAPSVRNNNRYWGMGVTYDQNNFGLTASVESYLPARREATDGDDGYIFSFGGNYDLGFAKPYVSVQLGKNLDFVGNMFKTYNDPARHDIRFTAIHLGAAVPIGAAVFKMDSFYSSSKETAGVSIVPIGSLFTSLNHEREWGITASYEYHLSQRTMLYGVAGYVSHSMDSKVERRGYPYTDLSQVEKTLRAGIGLRHAF